MSDAGLRELERRWRETDTLEDEARYLAERVRQGELAEAALRLAAEAGYEAAEAVVGSRCEPTPLREWVTRLHAIGGLMALRRAALGVTKLALARLTSDPLSLRDGTSAAWEEARMYVLCPCGDHMPQVPLGKPCSPGAPLAYRLWQQLIGIAYPNICADAVEEAARRLGEKVDSDEAGLLVRQGVRDALVPWALGVFDPLLTGWATPTSKLTRRLLLERLPEVIMFTDWHLEREYRRLVLDPWLLENARTTSVEEAVARALEFRPADSDTPEALAEMEAMTVGVRTRGEQVQDMEWFLTVGWREVPPASLRVARLRDYDFSF